MTVDERRAAVEPVEQEPISKLEPGGKAAILNYNIPDTTTYPGRSFIHLDLGGLVAGDEDPQRVLFKRVSLGPPSLRPEIERFMPLGGPVGTTVTITGSHLSGATTVKFGPIEAEGLRVVSDNELTVEVPADAKTGFLTVVTPKGVATSLIQFVVPEEATVTSSTSPANPGVLLPIAADQGVVQFGHDRSLALLTSGPEQVSDGIQQLRPETLAAIEQSGLRPQLFRTALGTLSVRMLPKDGPIVPEDDSDVPSGDPPPRLDLVVTAPQSGDSFAGPESGVPIEVSGTLTSSRVAVTRLVVQVGHASAQPVTRSGAAWSLQTTATQQGPVQISVTASGETLDGDPISRHVSRVINISFVQPAQGDTNPPTLAIVTPAANDVLQPPDPAVPDPFPLEVTISGTATDVALEGETASGVALVEFTIDGDPTGYRRAEPTITEDWSNWTATATLSKGVHRITARAVDNAGNQTERTNTFVVTEIAPVATELLLVEQYRLSSFLGDYGAGRTLKTFSLLPGERTKISIKTYKRTTEEAKQASSILDSFTATSADEFQRSVQDEQNYKQSYDESFKYNVQGQAQASWGWGSASISAGISGGTNSAREEFAKNVASATSKHAASASSKRDVSITTSREVREETGEETALEREIENINVGRTLNFVFRQMNQEFITILHLVDVRVGIVQVFEGPGLTTYHEVTLPQLKSLLGTLATSQDYADLIYQVIKHQLENVLDYQGERKSLVEERKLSDTPGDTYLRVKPQQSTWKATPASDREINVPGIIMYADTNVLRTDGVICDAILGQGDALDAYSHGLQDQAVATRRLANALTAGERDKIKAALQIVRDRDAAAAAVFEQVFLPKPVPGDDGGPGDGRHAPSQQAPRP